METWMQMISTVGFPIVAVMACSFFIFKVWQNEQVQNERREKDNLETITRLSGILSENSKALLKNSETLEKISEKLTSVEEKIDDVQKDVTELKIRDKGNRE